MLKRYATVFLVNKFLNFHESASSMSTFIYRSVNDDATLS